MKRKSSSDNRREAARAVFSETRGHDAYYYPPDSQGHDGKANGTGLGILIAMEWRIYSADRASPDALSNSRRKIDDKHQGTAGEG